MPKQLSDVNRMNGLEPAVAGIKETSACERNSMKKDDRRRTRSKFISFAIWPKVSLGFLAGGVVVETVEGLLADGCAETETEAAVFGLTFGLKWPIRSGEGCSAIGWR